MKEKDRGRMKIDGERGKDYKYNERKDKIMKGKQVKGKECGRTVKYIKKRQEKEGKRKRENKGKEKETELRRNIEE